MKDFIEFFLFLELFKKFIEDFDIEYIAIKRAKK